MGNFSRDTFNELKHYVGVRLQQGVPIVDADWNEMESIRKYELEAFLKCFVGNGVPQGNDGFRIANLAVPAPNDFVIQQGNNTRGEPGRCLVEGWDVLINQDINYSAQPLFNEDIAKQWGVDKLEALTPPGADRTDVVYLDVWEREVNAIEDNNLVNPAIGIETCVRIKREWVVRVVEGLKPPDFDGFISAKKANSPEKTKGHVYYPLAALHSIVGQDMAMADLRQTGISLASQRDLEQVTRDAFGEDYTLDHDGQPNLKVSLREAVNAILRGGVPSTGEEKLNIGEFNDSSPIFPIVDNHGNIWIFVSKINGEKKDIFYKRYSRATNSWTNEVNLTSLTSTDYRPVVLLDGNGDIWLFWLSDRDGNWNVWNKRYINDIGDWEAEISLTSDGFNAMPFSPLLDTRGEIWLFWMKQRGSNFEIWYRRYMRTTSDTGSWENENKIITNEESLNFDYFLPISDNNGDVWLFLRTKNTSDDSNIHQIRYKRTTGNWGKELLLTTDQGSHYYTSLPIVDSRGDLWLFWTSKKVNTFDIFYRRFRNTTSEVWDPEERITVNDQQFDRNVFTLLDNRGDIWVFWQYFRTDNSHWGISYKRYIKDIVGGSWSAETNLISRSDRANPIIPIITSSSNGDIWVFWNTYKDNNLDIWYKRFTRTSDIGNWGPEIRLTIDLGFDFNPQVVLDGNGDVWVFWTSIRGGTTDVWYKKFIISI